MIHACKLPKTAFFVENFAIFFYQPLFIKKKFTKKSEYSKLTKYNPRACEFYKLDQKQHKCMYKSHENNTILKIHFIRYRCKIKITLMQVFISNNVNFDFYSPISNLLSLFKQMQIFFLTSTK